MPNAKAIPVYKLYGEREPWSTLDMVHCESIAARSKLHNWQIKPHQHNGLFQLLHLQGGGAEIRLDEARYAMAPGEVLLVPQMCVHGFRFEHNAVGHVVTLAYPLIQKLTRQAGDGLAALTAPSIHKLGDDAEGAHIRMAFDALEAEYRGNARYRELMLESLLLAILVWLARSAWHRTLDTVQGGGKAARHFADFSDLIEVHYREHQPVSWYARRLGITAAHLNAVCRQTVGKSALELLHERMLLEAKRGLVYTSMTVSVLAYAIGFSDPAYFTRFFKREIGMSPKEFRRRAGT